MLWLAAVWHNGRKQIVNGTFRWPAGRAAHRAEMLKQRKEATKVRLKAAKDSAGVAVKRRIDHGKQ